MEKSIGKITHFYSGLMVGIIELSGALKVGDTIKIKGANTDFDQTVGTSLSISFLSFSYASSIDASKVRIAPCQHP